MKNLARLFANKAHAKSALKQLQAYGQFADCELVAYNLEEV